MRAKLDALWAYICTLDPGTMRSICWALFGVLGMDRGETSLTYACGLAMVALGVASAIMPPRKPTP